ncbi:hypothetical protein AHMF7605_17125 [Adhaeribacter arboris]|uniref:IrrE N-terminal-like domain-containing protein n=1 Tax=Adhaeribacter arboris TaxID=2072846 RepID=A0A2T2YHX8_9BACT|nr:ImmA/IrrE family metallo-endopeptidase [Adhaeribacter arboris]PSR55102.1 hypothetical protein AHMF7605_17125 [Adhaeribacter arboris]
MKTEVNFNADIITWAIARAGYELQEFAMFPIQDWLDNKKRPTVKQLEKFSNKVHIPFGYLFLKEPPKENLPFPFFRTGRSQTEQVSINVYDTILLTQRRQEWLIEFLEENNYEPLPFVGKFDENTDFKIIVEDIHNTLGLKNEWASSFSKFQDTLDFLTRKIEDIGIIINFNSVVGTNNTRPISVNECRGFVLVNAFAPFMFVNSADAKAAQLFTIVHELAHIWIGKSAGFDFRKLQPADAPIELLCDKVAAEFLVPENSFNQVWDNTPSISVLAKHFKVSQLVIARRALDLRKVSKQSFFKFYNDYIEDLKAKKEEKKSSGGDFYASAKKKISPTFAAYVDRAIKGNALLYRDAYRLTGLKGDTYQTFMNKLYQ